MNTWKPNLEQTKQHYTRWWRHEGVVVNMWEHFQQGVTPHADIPQPEPPRSLNQRWFDPEWRARYIDWYVAHSSLKADILPVANTQLGPGSLAAILGGVFEGGDDTIWIHPNPHFTDDITFDSKHPNYLLHKDLLRACKQRAQGHYYVGMPDLMEGLDVLAALKGTDRVLMDTVMQPEVVERQMQQINDIYFQVFDELYDIIREGDEMAFCYFSSWAPGKMTKLQSDISTMISEDDYRRFVQPYIREQCRRIPFTLYHLDGVGAIRHLPALLEISELNAIQWTPGVGEPQGGSPKWFDLYRRILRGGKSILCSWVTIDELPALLDAVGTDGIHLEMDFHNEHEVERALEIVERARCATGVVTPATERGQREDSLLSGSLGEASLLLLDGAMGTMVQRVLPDFQGCSEQLVLRQPDIISTIHRKYLAAGADMIETCTFNAQRISLADYGMQDQVRDINLAACRIAREAAAAYSHDKPRFVLGSIGPTNQTVTPTSDATLPLQREQLAAAYREQIEALIDGGVDGLLIETIFDVENARVCIDTAVRVMKQRSHTLPILLSFSVSTPDGHNMLGQDILQFIHSLTPTANGLQPPIFSVGINCHGHVAEIAPLIRRLGKETPYRISLYPNAGHPDALGHYAKSPENLQADLWPLIEGHYLNIIGGCCGTTDAHIAQLAQTIQPIPGLFISPHIPHKLHPSSEYTSSAPSPLSPASQISIARQEDVAVARPSRQVSLRTSILQGQSDAAVKSTEDALDRGIDPQTLVNEEMIAAMTELGRLFEQGKAFVPQLLMAGRAMKAAMKVIDSAHRESHSLGGTMGETLNAPAPQKIVIGTVKGDLHDIGKNLVAAMLEGCGFEVINVGIDVSAERFIEAVKENKPDVLALSALLTTTMPYMREVIEQLERAGIRHQVKVIVGGAPVSQRFADEIGADGYSDNANSAVALVRKLLKR